LLVQGFVIKPRRRFVERPGSAGDPYPPLFRSRPPSSDQPLLIRSQTSHHTSLALRKGARVHFPPTRSTDACAVCHLPVLASSKSFYLSRLVAFSLAVSCSSCLICASPSCLRRLETLKMERSGTVVARCGELKTDRGSLDGKSGGVRTDEWKTNGVATA
jgi:hypothetical protein